MSSTYYMTDELQKFLKRAFLNNSFDYDSMDTSLIKTWNNSFSYLYVLQQSLIDYAEIYYYSNDDTGKNSKQIGNLYLDKWLYANFDIDYDVIHVYQREEYRRSEFYYRPYTIQDMMEHPEIFWKIPMVLIDNQVIWDFKMVSEKDCTRFILPFKRSFVLENFRDPETDEEVYKDHFIQVIVVDNIYYERVELNKSLINHKPISQTFSIPKEYLDSNIPTKQGSFFCSFHFPNALGNDYELGTTMIPLKDDGDSLVGELTDQQNIELRNFSRNFYISIVFMNRLIPHEFYFGGNVTTINENNQGNLFVVQRDEMLPYECPVPVNNFMIFKKGVNDDNWHLEKNNRMISLHYPNIYEVIDEEREEGDQYKIYYYYYNEIDFKYTVLFDFYFIFLLETFLDYSESNIYYELRDLYDKTIQNDIEKEVIENFLSTHEYREENVFGRKRFFFTDETDGVEKYYTPKINYRPIEEILDGIYNNTLDYSQFTEEQLTSFKEAFEKIYIYKFFQHLYGETDFIYRYGVLPENKEREPIQYKDKTLREWMRIEPHVLREYVKEQKRLGSSYHLFCNTLNLEDRIRTDTSREMGKSGTSQYQEFDEPRYVFAMENERPFPMLLDASVYVDGLYVMDLIQERHLFMDYFYIPCDLVKEDSYIEIEVFPGYTFREDITFDSIDDEKVLTLTKPAEAIWPTLADIYFTSDANHYIRYDEDFFDISPHFRDKYDDIGEILAYGDDTEDPIKYVRMVPMEFRIKPNSDTVVGVPLELRFHKNQLRLRVMITRKGFPHFMFNEQDWMFHSDYIRIYYKGRLLPRCKYQFMSHYRMPRLMIFQEFEIGEEIFIDISPYRYTQIYYQEELTEGNTLVDLTGGTATIDLRGKINKPFDVRYYDVYMNGRKLSINNIFSVTPWQITMVNLHSIYNLEIYERERDWEYFGLDYTERIYYYTIDDLFKENFITEDVKNKMLKDLIDNQKDPRLIIHPNTNEEERMDHSDIRKFVQFFLFYHDELIPKTFSNPDRLQENKELMEEVYFYIDYYFTRTPYMEAPTQKLMKRRRLYPRTIILDPDVTVGEDNPNYLFYVFPVGHLEDKDLPEEYLDESQTPVFLNDPDIMFVDGRRP